MRSDTVWASAVTSKFPPSTSCLKPMVRWVVEFGGVTSRQLALTALLPACGRGRSPRRCRPGGMRHGFIVMVLSLPPVKIRVIYHNGGTLYPVRLSGHPDVMPPGTPDAAIRNHAR